MAPTATLRAACAAARDGDYAEAADRLRAYRRWRRTRGLEPLCVTDRDFAPTGTDGDRLAELVGDFLSACPGGPYR